MIDLFRVQGAIDLLRTAHARQRSDSSKDSATQAVVAAELQIGSRVIDTLPNTHPHVLAERRGGDADRWEGLADRYMHPHESTFEPAEIYEMVAALPLQGFATALEKGTAATGSSGMQLVWHGADDYDPRKAAPQMFAAGGFDYSLLNESEAAQLAHQVHRAMRLHTFVHNGNRWHVSFIHEMAGKYTTMHASSTVSIAHA